LLEKGLALESERRLGLLLLDADVPTLPLFNLNQERLEVDELDLDRLVLQVVGDTSALLTSALGVGTGDDHED
jgi:hypothetical protein